MEAARWSICTHTERSAAAGHAVDLGQTATLDVRTARWTHTNQAPTSTRPTPPARRSRWPSPPPWRRSGRAVGARDRSHGRTV